MAVGCYDPEIRDKAGRVYKFLLFILTDTGVPDNMGSTAGSETPGWLS
jgi:hypothetical protein